jgi:hypothetical protein
MSVRPSVRPSVRTVVIGSLDLAARAIVLQAFLFDLAKIDTDTEFYCAGQMNRARGARVLELQRVAEHCDFLRQQPNQRRSLSIVSDCWRVWHLSRTTVKLGPHYIHEGERRGQSSETAIEASFFFYKRPSFSDWIKADRLLF